MIAFAVSDVEQESPPLERVKLGVSIRERVRRKLTAGASNLDGLVPCVMHPVVQAAHYAFAQHRPLTLSPDDVWLCIAQGFGLHVFHNAEALRSRLVAHAGEQTITVRRDDFVRDSPDNDWPGVTAEYSDRLANHIGRTRDLIVADFSTTTDVSKVASEIVLMSAMRTYFSYDLTTLCGIPSITLLGTVSDWKAIRCRAEELREFKLEWWIVALVPILDQFAAAAAGNVDLAFWQSFYKLQGGSGGPYVTGWINALFPYITSSHGVGKYRYCMRTNEFVDRWDCANGDSACGPSDLDFPLGLSSAPFDWEYFGTHIRMELLGGFVGVAQDPESLAVRPAIGWAVAEAVERP